MWKCEQLSTLCDVCTGQLKKHTKRQKQKIKSMQLHPHVQHKVEQLGFS